MTLATTQSLDLVVTHIHPYQGKLIDRIFWRLFGIAAQIKLHGPVAASLFMFMRATAFRVADGFDERMLLGDDVELARAIHPSRYALAPTFVFTSTRRFRTYGYGRTFREYLAVFFLRKRRLRNHANYFAVRYQGQNDKPRDES